MTGPEAVPEAYPRHNPANAPSFLGECQREASWLLSELSGKISQKVNLILNRFLNRFPRGGDRFASHLSVALRPGWDFQEGLQLSVFPPCPEMTRGAFHFLKNAV